MITLGHYNVKATLTPSTMFDLSYIIPKLKGDPLFLRYNIINCTLGVILKV